MSLIDKLRPQPEWKDADPGVRIVAVQQLAPEDADADGILSQVVRDDTDARVRQAAVERLGNPQLLKTVVSDDPDEAVRATAVATLLDLACSSEGESVGAAALEGLTNPRDLADVARIASREVIAYAALQRVTETKSLGAVARRADHVGVRLEALRRITDPDELTTVAIKSEHKDVALAALERLIDEPVPPEDAIGAIAARAKNKVTARRAKAARRDREQVAASVAVDDAATAERQEVCTQLDALADSVDWSAVTDGLREAEGAWAKLPPLEPADDLAVRFIAAAEMLRTRFDAHYRAQAELQRRREAHAAAAEPRIALCERVEQVGGDRAPEVIDAGKIEWADLPASEALDEDEAVGLTRRFEDGCAAALRRHAHQDEIQEWRAQVVRALEPIEAQVGAARLQEVAAAWPAVKKTWPALEGAWSDELRTRVDAIDAALWASKEAPRTADTRRRRANLARLSQRCDQLEALVASESITVKQAERGYHDVRAAIDRPDQLPTKRDRAAIAKRFSALHTTLYTKLHELREIDSWKRWANVGVQEELCQRVEALAQVEDLAQVATQLRACVTQWKLAATVPRDRAGELWQRFKTGHDAAYARCTTFFAEQAEAHEANLKQKVALCEQVEALATSTDWVKTAARIVELQAEWKTGGAAPRKQSKAIWKRFRRACDQFFDRRKADLAERKHVWAKNYERKEALCREAEALGESADASAVEAVKRLQVEWRKVGPVKRSRSDAIWERFRAACGQVSDRVAEKEEAALADKVAAREALCAELEALLPAPDAGPADTPDGLAERIKAIRQRWEQAGAVPHRRAQSLAFRFREAVGKLVVAHPTAFHGTDLDPVKSRRRMEQLCERVEKLLPSPGEASGRELSPGQLLAQRWRETLAANTMGVKADPAAERRANAEAVKRAQTEWMRITPLYGEAGEQLAARFKDVCDRFFTQFPALKSKPALKAMPNSKSKPRTKPKTVPKSKRPAPAASR